MLYTKTLRIISDIHDKTEKYLDIIKDCDYSIQLGDVNWVNNLNNIDGEHHKFILGNHNNHEIDVTLPHWMGHYGEFNLNGIKGFFCGGAFSIDWKWRVDHEKLTGEKLWWNTEQLSIPQLHKMVELYKEVKPDFMLSHSCPVGVSRKFFPSGCLKSYGHDPKTFTTNTQEALQECFEYHQPKLHIFGHFHCYKNKVWKGTRFVCQKELGYVDINENLEIVGSNEPNSKHYNI